VRTVCASVRKPVNVVIGISAARFTAAELAEAGARRISIGSSLARLVYGAFTHAAREMQASGTFDFVDSAMRFAELEPLVLRR